MIDDQCSWQKVFDFYADYKGLDTFRVAGSVTDAGRRAGLAYPVVVIYRGTTLYGWVMGDEAGHYTADLPDESGDQAVPSPGREVGHDAGRRERGLHRRHRPRRRDRPRGRRATWSR